MAKMRRWRVVVNGVTIATRNTNTPLTQAWLVRTKESEPWRLGGWNVGAYEHNNAIKRGCFVTVAEVEEYFVTKG